MAKNRRWHVMSCSAFSTVWQGHAPQEATMKRKKRSWSCWGTTTFRLLYLVPSLDSSSLSFAWAKSFTITISCYFECVYLMTSHFLSSHTKVENDSAREKKEGKELTVKVGKKEPPNNELIVCAFKKGALRREHAKCKQNMSKCTRKNAENSKKVTFLKTYFSCTHILIEKSL